MSNKEKCTTEDTQPRESLQGTCLNAVHLDSCNPDQRLMVKEEREGKVPLVLLSYVLKRTELKYMPGKKILTGLQKYYPSLTDLVQGKEVIVIQPIPGLATVLKQNLVNMWALASQWDQWALVLMEHNWKITHKSGTLLKQREPKFMTIETK